MARKRRKRKKRKTGRN